jgi:transposase
MRRLKFIDESGINLAMTRLYGRAPRGERVLDAVPRNYGPNVTMVGALGMQGITAVMTVEGATDADVCFAYIEHVLAPTLQPGDLVVMDHLRAHNVADVPSAIGARGAHVPYLPPYAPDLSPIEPCWSTLKTSLRKANARTREALDTAMTDALATITVSDARSWFRPCGYALQ